MKITKKEIYSLIESEIKWCQKKENQTMPYDWTDGFIHGLKQAKNLVKKMRLHNKKLSTPPPTPHQ
jgi:hypothetical protein